jgi:hypothetical protein
LDKAVKYGLVKDYTKSKNAKREWANRYDERLATNAYDDPSRHAEDEWGNPGQFALSSPSLF